MSLIPQCLVIMRSRLLHSTVLSELQPLETVCRSIACINALVGGGVTCIVYIV